jgi:hypothetical protein
MSSAKPNSQEVRPRGVRHLKALKPLPDKAYSWQIADSCGVILIFVAAWSLCELLSWALENLPQGAV